MITYLYDFEVTESIYCNVEVEFELSSPGSVGDYWTEPEGPEFEITGISVLDVWGGNPPHGWEKSPTEMGDWLPWLEEKVLELVDQYPDLYELQYDEWQYGEP